MRYLSVVSLLAIFFFSNLQAQEITRLQKIKSDGVLKVCIWPGYISISYKNPRTSKLEGIDIDMAKEFAKSLGVSLKFVDSSFAKLKQNMTNNVCDISMHSVGVTDDRKTAMDFTEPHLISGIYAVVMKSNKYINNWSDIDKAGHYVVVLKGSYMGPVMKSHLKHATLSVVNSFKAREQEVLSGRADVFMTDYPYGKRMQKLTNWAKLLEPPTTLAPTPYAYAVPKNEPEWLQVANDFVKTVKKDGRLARAAAKHGLTPIVAH